MRRFLWVVLFAFFGTLFVPSVAHADDIKVQEFEDRIYVLQLNPFLRKGRVEIAPKFHASFNDSLQQQLGGGLDLNYHLFQWLYIGATGNWQDWRFISDETNGLSGQYERTIDATDAIPEVSILNGYVGALVGFVPVYGKLALFNSAIIHWDLSVAVGGGGIFSRANGPLGGGLLTVGQRFFVLDWLSLNVDVRGLFYAEELDPANGTKFFTHWQAGVGVAFWLPTSFEYESL